MAGDRRGNDEIGVGPPVVGVLACDVPGADELAVGVHGGRLAGDALVVAAAQVDALVAGREVQGELAVAAVAATAVGDVDGVGGAFVLVDAGAVPELTGDDECVPAIACAVPKLLHSR
jgi:hypothetical protein